MQSTCNLCFSQEQTVDSTQTLLEVDFQKAFVHDTVTFTVNEYLIFKDIILTTNTIIDCTDFWVSITTISNNKIAVFYKGETDNKIFYTSKTRKIRQTKQGHIFLTVALNKKEFKYDIDLSKGKYIGLNKSENALIIIQQERKFIYD